MSFVATGDVPLVGEGADGDVLDGDTLRLEQYGGVDRPGNGDGAGGEGVELDGVGPVEATGRGGADEVAALGARTGHVVAHDGGAPGDELGFDLGAVDFVAPTAQIRASSATTAAGNSGSADG